MRLAFTSRAEEDLEAIADYIAADNPRRALSFVRELRTQCRRITKLVSEDFDHPPLDTLILAMPVSWKGTLQQYAGRLHREHASKTDVRIIDFVDTGHPALLRMWDKRQQAASENLRNGIPAAIEQPGYDQW